MADKNNTALSLCVDKVLDHVGASEQIRRNHVEKGMVDEVLFNLTVSFRSHVNTRLHNFGSWCEGTTTKGLASDIDKLEYGTDFPAVEKIPDGSELCYLIINDGTARPGYVKLQLVINGIPIVNNAVQGTDTDQFRRVCLANGPRMNISDWPIQGAREVHTGPASTILSGPTNLFVIDYVFAYRCYTIPSFANEWINRPRKYDWPSKQLLDKMSTYGCFLVGKGYPSSQTEHIEWRISFSFQERELMFNLNSTQHKCYILLKMIKHALGSKMKIQSVSSYHLKTALFYTIENNPIHIWIPENLVYCTELCLKQLLDWLNNKNCPNFFVPEENMFDRLSSDVMKMTVNCIRDMLDSDGQYLMLLTCDKFGELLQESLSGKVLSNLSRDAIEFDLDSRMHALKFSSLWTNRIVTSTNRNSATETLSALQALMKQIRNLEKRLTSEKMLREIKIGISVILPTIHLQIAQTIAAVIITVTDADKKRELMQDFNNHIEQAKDVNIMSQRLIKASLLFKENKLEECERILADCEISLKDCILTTVHPESLSSLELSKYLAQYLMFLPSQSDLAPTPLQYELYRSVGADTDTFYTEENRWFGGIVIDAKLYLFFLQYLVCSKLNKQDFANRAEIKLALYVFKTPIVTKRLITGHRETGFNLLAWIFKYENNTELATKLLYKSWQIRPDHNAAKWHMLLMMYEQYKQRSKR